MGPADGRSLEVFKNSLKERRSQVMITGLTLTRTRKGNLSGDANVEASSQIDLFVGSSHCQLVLDEASSRGCFEISVNETSLERFTLAISPLIAERHVSDPP